MSTAVSTISADATVNEIVRAFPATLPVFNEFGIDSCCGGGIPLKVAAERDGADVDVLVARLRAVVEKA